MSRLSKVSFVLVAAFVALAGLLLHLTLGPAETSWTVDDAGKSLVLRQMQRNGGQPWLEYPGRSRDPDLLYFPQPLRGAEPYASVLPDGRILSQYTSPFVALTLPFAAAGDIGRAVLPALGGGACVLLAGALARRRGGTQRAAIFASILVALATPLLFYSSVFWEHTLVAALATGAFVMLTEPGRERPLLAGLLLGAAILLREEMLLFALAIAAALFLARRPRRSVLRFAIGCAVGAAALLAWNLAIAGTPFGVHIGANRPALLVNAPRALAALLVDPGLSGVPLVIPTAAAIALAAFPRARRLTFISLAILAAVSALAFARFPGQEDRALALQHSNSMLVAVPWALVALAPRRRDDLPVVASLLFISLFVLFVPARSITGVHPGPRMLLPILPALAAAFAASFNSSAGRARVALVIALVGVGMAWSARSLVLLHEKRTASSRIAAALAQDARRIVLTDLFWLPLELSFLDETKEFHLVTSPRDLADLAARCAADGVREVLYVTSPGTIRNRTPIATITNSGLSRFSVEIHVLRP